MISINIINHKDIRQSCLEKLMLKERESLLTQNSQISQVFLTNPRPSSQDSQRLTTTTLTQKKQRLKSLDILRGLTIMGMLVVDDLMDGPAWIDHPDWNGFTLADLIFPSFLFIMGMAVPLSLSKGKPFRARNLFRIVALFGIGVLLNLFEVKFNFEEFRVMGILQRLSLCYGALCFVHVITNYGEKSYRFVGVLFCSACAMIYLTFMLTFQNEQIGCPHSKNLDRFCNFGAYWDRKMFGQHHMIYPNDPEGLFTTLTSFLNAYAGYWFCLTMYQNKNNTPKTIKIWILSASMCALTAVPLLWLMPLNKKLWSISYTFLTMGISGISLALITILMDVIQKQNMRYQKIIAVVTAPMIWMGMNPLAIFVSRDFLDDLLNTYVVINGTEAWQHLYHYLFETWIQNKEVASLMFSLFLLLFFILEAYLLFRNNVFIKL